MTPISDSTDSTTSLKFIPKVELSGLLQKRKIISATVAHDGTLVLLVVGEGEDKVAFPVLEQPGGATFPETKSTKAYKAWLLRIRNGIEQEVEISTMKSAYPRVDVLPDGGFIVVSCRCKFADGKGELNARLYDADGSLQKELCFGDGIEDIATTADSRIWVSYFDEGVFGNYGWDDPMGYAGLNCFDTEGKIIWQYPLEDSPHSIDDCYAMTINRDEVWMCFYSDFPIARVEGNHQIKYWRNKVAGARCIAIDRELVMLYGGYQPNLERLVVQKLLDDGSCDVVLDGTLAFPKHKDFLKFTGRANALHAITDDCWYQFASSDFPDGWV